jgi:non-homologous end joining protein Ku
MEISMVAPRAAWKGFLRVGSVSCGVKIVGDVIEAEKIRFNVPIAAIDTRYLDKPY